MSTNDIENILRRAPQPKPPRNLEQRLKAQALSAPRLSPAPSMAPHPSGSWMARWWSALAPTVVTLACAATLTVQQNELRKLRTNLETPSSSPEPAAQNAVSSPGLFPSSASGQIGASSEQAELGRLKAMVSSLTSEVSKLEQMRTDNEKLRAQVAARSAGTLTAEETKAVEEARDRALRIQCINNLKQLGLAVRVWANDNGEMTPPNLLSMSNEIGSFKIMVCPADTGRQAASDASSFSPANCSYEYLVPSVPDNEPNRIAFRCPIHGNIGLIDGSVQSEIAKKHPDWIVQRDGKYIFQVPEPAADANAAPGAGGQSQ